MSISFESSVFKHDPDTIKSYFKIVKDKTIVTENINVIFPSGYLNKELATITPTGSRMIGMYAIIDNNNHYGKVLTPIFQTLLPNNIDVWKIDDGEYQCLVFNKGDVFLLSNTLPVFNSYLYSVFDYHFLRGNIPWYMTYEDVCSLLSEGQKFCNSSIGDNPFNYEVLTSTIAKDPKDKRILFRNGNSAKPKYVGMSDIRYGYNNTGSRLIGGYFKDGLVASIVDPETIPSKSVEILRY